MMREDKIVVIVGSGRSGTTWLGSLLDSYERAEYFYEVTNYRDLDIDNPGIIKIKYPLSFWLPYRFRTVSKIERGVMKLRVKYGVGRGAAERSLRIHKPQDFNKKKPDVKLFKIVTPIKFALRTNEFMASYKTSFKAVHIIRNPFSYLASEIRQHEKNPERAKRHFRERIDFILGNEYFEKYHALAAQTIEKSWLEHMVVLWRISNEILFDQPQLDILHVVYEELCRNTTHEVEDIYRFLDWPMLAQTVRHIEETTGIDASESGSWSIKKNADESMSRWRDEISDEQYLTARSLLAESQLLGLWSEQDLTR